MTPGVFTPRLAERPVHRREASIQRAGLVGQTEFEEGGLLDDPFGATRVGDPGQLHHDPLTADLLDEGLGDPELVGPFPQHLNCPFDVLRGIGGHLVRLVELEGQVHAALEVEPVLDGDFFDLHVVHHPVGSTLPGGDLARDQIDDRHGDENASEYQSITNGSKHDRSSRPDWGR